MGQNKKNIITEIQRIKEMTACKCGCQGNNIDNSIIYAALEIEAQTKRKIKITSGFRCKKYNKKILGAPNSAHCPDTEGKSYALDIHCNDSKRRYELLNAILNIKIGRIGIYENHIHIDTSPHHLMGIIWYGK